MTGQPDRLDSWKEIAEYLGRDVRTAMRWAKSQGLPVRRVAGGRGRSVFAFAREIDQWLAGRDEPATGTVLDPPVPEARNAPALPGPARFSVRRILAAALLVAVFAGGAAALMSRTSPRSSDPVGVQVTATKQGVLVEEAGAAPRLIYPFDQGLSIAFAARRPAAVLTVLVPSGPRVAIAGISFSEHQPQKKVTSGELIAMDLDGRVVWRYRSDHAPRYRHETFANPYVVSDWQLAPSAGAPARVAVASHHWTWWASPIVILNHDGHAGPAFVHPGWIESLAWLDDRRIVAGGFNNLRDGAVVMLLDIEKMHGQAPGAKGTEFECLSCGDDTPLFYATLPRSELNRVTGSRFNRAQVEVQTDRILATTIEIPAEAEPATAIYEFSRDMKFLRARYSVSYWDWHRKLEAEGRVKHTRETCPHRNGPPVIDVWDRASNKFVSNLQLR